MALSHEMIAAATPTERPFKLFDGHGVYLIVNPDGSKYWRLKYRFLGKEGCISLGVYPRVSLDDARACASQARELLRRGVNPSVERKAQAASARRAKKIAADNVKALRVISIPDGTFELWKGGCVIHLNPDEARFAVRLLSTILS